MAKNSPTPKRKVAQAKNLRPIVSQPIDKKKLSPEEKKELKSKEKQARLQDRQNTMLALSGEGDAKYLPDKDKGEIKKFIRSHVDSKVYFVQFFLPVVFFTLIFATAIRSQFPQISVSITLFVYVLFIVVLAEIFIRSRSLKKSLKERFGDKSVARGSGNISYGISRMTQPKRLRSPKVGV